MVINDALGLSGFIGLNAAFAACLLIILCTLLYLILRKDELVHLIEVLTFFQSGCFLLAVGSLMSLLQLNAFEYPLVFDAVEVGMRWYQKLGGLWSGQANSLLFWSALMSAGASAGIVLGKRTSRRAYIPAVAGIIQFILAFFVVPVIFFNQPFNRLWTVSGQGFVEAMFAPPGSSLIVPLDGVGMNPSLRHIAMLLHPPFLYLGLIGFFIPYAFALAALMIADHESEWVPFCFPLALAAWACLTVGMFLGSWWAYTILGWGGYWGWDAVEISGLLPWLLSFSLLHSMRLYIRRRAAACWVYALSLAIVILIMFGVLLTRSGLIESVHAYSAGAMGPVLTVLIAVNLLTALALLVKRRTMVAGEVNKKAADREDRLIIVFNILIVMLTALYLFGQTLPLTSQIFSPEKRSFSPEQYEGYSAPLLLGLMIVTALCPSARLWDAQRERFRREQALCAGAATLLTVLLLLRYTILPILSAAGFWAAFYLIACWLAALWRDILWPAIRPAAKPASRVWGQLGTILVHLGFGVMSLGILGAENLNEQAEIYLGMMESMQLDFVTIQTEPLVEERVHDGQTDYMLDVLVQQDGKEFRLTPVLEYFNKLEVLHAQPAIDVSLARDVQVVMTALPQPPENQVTLRVYVFPLMSWIWAGGALMTLGGIIRLAGVKRQA